MMSRKKTQVQTSPIFSKSKVQV